MGATARVPAQPRTVYDRRLAVRLRSLRDASGLTREQAAARLEWSVSKLYRFEYARKRPTRRDMRDVGEVYGLSRTERDELIALIEAATKGGWWTAFHDVYKGNYVAFEDNAATIRSYEADLIPGLLQTPDYARAVIRALFPEAPAGEVERRVSARVARQCVFERERPPDLSVVVNEGVLLRCMACPPQVATVQMSALIEASTRPNIDVRVLPFSAGVHPCMDGSFVLFDFAEPGDTGVAYVEGLTGDVYVEEPAQIASYDSAWNRMREAVLTAEESRRFFSLMLKESQS